MYDDVIKTPPCNLLFCFLKILKLGLIFGDLKERGPYFPIFLQRHISSLVYGKFQTIFYSQKKKNLRFLMMFMQEK